MYNHAVHVPHLYHWLLTSGDSRWDCDDFDDGVSSGDFWKVFVRLSATATKFHISFSHFYKQNNLPSCTMSFCPKRKI